jgi:MFS family permease
MFATHLQKDLHLAAGMVAMPIALANLVAFLASGFWGYVADIFGRRWAMIIPAAIGACVTPLYLFSDSYPMVTGAFILQGAFLGAIYGQNPAYLTERFPTEVRATASGFCYHQGAIWAGFTGPVLTYFAVSQPLGFAVPMLIATTGAAIMFVITLLFSSAGQIFAPAEAASIPSLVTRKQITEATSLFMTTVILTLVLGVPAATIAIGHGATAAVSNNDEFWLLIEEAARRAGDRVWRLPIFADYRVLLRSQIADLRNSEYGEAGAILGGMFIGEFARGKPWAHLDIAASSWNTNAELTTVLRGPSGAGTRLCIELAELMAGPER